MDDATRNRDLASEVATLLAEFAADRELAGLRPHLTAHLERLGERLRVAVIGEVNAGKSTLVNALVGKDVAETSGGELTYVNWWFRAGTPERMRLRRPDGQHDVVAIGTCLGDLDLGHPAPVEIFLDSTLLADLTVIDTPGLYSLRHDNSERTRRLLDQGRDQSVKAAREADALLYLTASDLPGARDQATLSRFTAMFGTVRVAPTNALMLLSRAERRADRSVTEDPLVQVDALARRYRADLFSYVWDIAPVSALAAALARTGRIDDGIAREVRALAAATAAGPGVGEPSPLRRRLLLSDDYLRSGLDGRGMSGLLALCDRGLGCYEMRAMLAAADRDEATAARLAGALEAASGLQAVEDLIRRTFADRGGIILADAALADIERRSYTLRPALPRRAASRVRARCEALRTARPELQDLVDARTAVDPAVRLEPEERSELAALFSGESTRLPAAEAGRRAETWMARANAVHTTPQQCAIALRAHTRYAEMLRGDDPA
jgi:hypothetical protein